MIQVSMNWEDMTLVVDGHAKYDEKGKDIVCAAVSALAQALLFRLEEDQQRGRMMMWYKRDEEKGYLRIKAQPNSGYREPTRAYFKLVMTGIKKIEEQYPDYVKIGEVWTHGNL